MVVSEAAERYSDQRNTSATAGQHKTVRNNSSMACTAHVSAAATAIARAVARLTANAWYAARRVAAAASRARRRVAAGLRRYAFGGHRRSDDDDEEPVPLSVNYHFTRQCNYSCGFCFHTAKTSFVLPLAEAKRGLTMLAEAGMRKLNFSGGEPFIKDRGRYMGELIRHCKTELRWAGISVSIVSNGSLIRESWMSRYAEHVDVLAVSCDSFDAATNEAIGRGADGQRHVAKVYEVREWCARYRVAFKLNTVVNACNVDEDFAEHVARLRPVRWKVFQCLLLDGENAGADAIRDAARFCVADERFDGFVRRHRAAVGGVCLVPEGNGAMRDSYLILDEYMRFLNCRNGAKEPSASLLDVGVRRALRGSGFDERAFRERGGVYVWDKDRLPDALLDW